MTRKHRFEGLVAWITGGGSGIGRAIALELAREGAAVALSGRRAARLDATVEAVRSAGGTAEASVCDVCDEDAVEATVRDVVAKLGKLDIVVANAGFAISGSIEKLDAADWRRQLDTNVVGLAITAKHALPELRKTHGRVVLMGSVAGFLASPGAGAYSASKHAVRAIGQALAMELHGTGVTCTTLHPGFVESDIVRVDNRGVLHASWEDRRPKNLIWPVDKAARLCVDAIYSRKREYVFTGHGKLGAWAGKHTPDLVHFAMTRNLVPRTRPETREPR